MIRIEDEVLDIENADNDGLGPYPGDGCAQFHCWEVNGWGAIEEADYVVTRGELILVARFWACRLVDRSYALEICDDPVDEDFVLVPFARRRLERIRRLLGDAVLDSEIDDQCKTSYKCSCRDRGVPCSEEGLEKERRKWAILVRGNPDEMNAL